MTETDEIIVLRQALAETQQRLQSVIVANPSSCGPRLLEVVVGPAGAPFTRLPPHTDPDGTPAVAPV